MPMMSSYCHLDLRYAGLGKGGNNSLVVAGASNALKMWGGHCLSKHRLIQGKFMVGRCPWVPGLQGLACHSEKWGGQSICCPPLYKKWGGHVPPVPHLSTPLGSGQSGKIGVKG